MKKAGIKIFQATLIFIIAFLPLGLAAQNGANSARITYLDDVVTMQKAVETDFDSVTVNLPVEAGDRVWTDETGRVEFQLTDGSIVRLDVNSKMDFQALSETSENYSDTTILKLWAGSIYINARSFDSPDKIFQIDTPSASAYLVEDGLFRIDLYEDGTTAVTVFSGVSEVIGEGGSVLVTGGQRTFVSPAHLPMNPEQFNSFERDDFDLWNDAREEAWANLISSDKSASAADMGLPQEVLPYYDELCNYGFWDYVPYYGWVWLPSHAAFGWRPYYDGYWYWYWWGWTWISYEPWGWCPYHYGRWDWLPGYGWAWSPGNVWSGAWVAWAANNNYIGWCPLNYYDSPAVKDPLKYSGHGTQNHPLEFSGETWTFVERDAITAKDFDSVKLPPEKIKRLDPASITLYKPDQQGHHTAKFLSSPNVREERSPASPTKTFSNGKDARGKEIPGITSRPSGGKTFSSTPSSSGKGNSGYTPYKPPKNRTAAPSPGVQRSGERKLPASGSRPGYYNYTPPGGSKSKNQSTYRSYYGTSTQNSGQKKFSSPGPGKTVGSSSGSKKSSFVSGFLNNYRNRPDGPRSPSSGSRPSSSGNNIFSGKSGSKPSGGGGSSPSGSGGSRSGPPSSSGNSKSGKKH